MLQLTDIIKTYPAGGDHVEALRGVNLRFRRNEFVSILGPSGCGKTTLLNIVGGLDRYTSGDLSINGRSTRDFRDRDWDAYRNHSIGFVFQNYNLIPHQTVLQNVELALTLSGVSKHERRQRAKEALEKVGLSDQLRKRPAEMSGGQMQRVAIARAIVNNPDIILADEPTGALDTETSLQVMDILRDIARDRLVIMVTHNPDLAEKYSTRIIRMLDGKITDDSRPLSEEELRAEKETDERESGRTGGKTPSMSLKTSFGLSLKNLFTKKGRTILTSFAGSIGIIGIALIYAVSNGMTLYINNVQEETLSSYPLTIESSHMDMSSMMETFMGTAQSSGEHPSDGVYQKAVMYDMLNAMGSMKEKTNDLKAFKAWLEASRSDPSNPLSEAVSGVRYTWNNDLLVYTKNVDGDIIVSDTRALMQNLLKDNISLDLSSLMSISESTMSGASTMSDSSGLWHEMLRGADGQLLNPLFEKQYDLVYGSWPAARDEIVLITDEDGELADITLYALGLIPQEQINRLMQATLFRQTVDYEMKSWSWAEICGLDFRVIPNADCFVQDRNTGLYTDLRETEEGRRYLYDNGIRLKVSGVLKPKPDALSTIIRSGLGYTYQLTEYLMEKGNSSPAVQAQIASPDTDILTGLPFRGSKNLSDQEKATALKKRVSGMTEAERAAAYEKISAVPSEETVAAAVNAQTALLTRETIDRMMIGTMTSSMGMEEDKVREYLAERSDEELMDMVRQYLEQQIRSSWAEKSAAELAGKTEAEKAALLDAALATLPEKELAGAYDAVVIFSDATQQKNLKLLGFVDPETPSSVSLYASSFAGKDKITEAIASYNQGKPELEQISYTDYVGLIMSSVTTIINAITYVLIAFVAISLIVSSIMIGVITLISVQERTREIGILRAIGASKRNVSSLFTAETVLIGFSSGLLGVCITWLLCIPINLILHHLTGMNSLSAYLNPGVALILVAISVLLTLVSGMIPSRSAAKKDPVEALRSE